MPPSKTLLPNGIVMGGQWPNTIITWPGGNFRGATKPEYDLAQALEQSQLELSEALKNYNELLYAVARKFPNETRHQTALRYIHEAEQSVLNADSIAQQEKDKPSWNDEVDKPS